jgi:hypothetical protein
VVDSVVHRRRAAKLGRMPGSEKQKLRGQGPDQNKGPQAGALVERTGAGARGPELHQVRRADIVRRATRQTAGTLSWRPGIRRASCRCSRAATRTRDLVTALTSINEVLHRGSARALPDLFVGRATSYGLPEIIAATRPVTPSGCCRSSASGLQHLGRRDSDPFAALVVPRAVSCRSFKVGCPGSVSRCRGGQFHQHLAELPTAGMKIRPCRNLCTRRDLEAGECLC